MAKAKEPKAKKEVKKAREVKKPKARKVEAAPAGEYVPRLKDQYAKTVLPRLMEQFGYKNRFRVPRLTKVVVNIGMGKAVQNPKLLETAVKELGQIAGQQPVVTNAKKSIAGFKIRVGMPIGCRVTLRGNRMYEFLDRLCSVALPRIRDFRGVSPKSFDGRGNYTIGIRSLMGWTSRWSRPRSRTPKPRRSWNCSECRSGLRKGEVGWQKSR
jgi:large subunit ribosomal protein L5